MPLSSHLRLEVFVRVNGGINLRHILFILPPAVFWRLVAPAIQLVVKWWVSVARYPPNPEKSCSECKTLICVVIVCIYVLWHFASQSISNRPITRKSNSMVTPIIDAPSERTISGARVICARSYLQSTDASMVEVRGVEPRSFRLYC